MSDKFILKGHEPVPATLMEWAAWYEISDRHVAKASIGDIEISTVFLGLNHEYEGGPPLIFETMIFGGPHDQYQERCSTWEQAEAMHAKAVELVSSGEAKPVVCEAVGGIVSHDFIGGRCLKCKMTEADAATEQKL